MNSYLLFKSLHLIAVISWMAGLLYYLEFSFIILKIIMKLFQMFLKPWKKIVLLYHDTSHDIKSWLFGLILIHEIGFNQLASLWLKLKLILVLFLTHHFYLGAMLNKFKLIRIKKPLNFIVILMKYRLCC